MINCFFIEKAWISTHLHAYTWGSDLISWKNIFKNAMIRKFQGFGHLKNESPDED